MNHAEMDELYELYALGVLEAPLASAIDEHIATNCDYCRAHMEEAMNTTASLAALAGLHNPPPAVRERVLTAIGAPTRPASRRPAWVAPSLAAASVAFAVLFGWQTLRVQQEQARTEEREHAAAGARAQTTAERNESQAARTQIDALNQRLSEAQSQLLTLTQTVAAERGRAGVAQRDVASAREDAARLHAQADQLTAQLANSRDEITAARNNIASLQSRLDANQSEAAAVRSELATLQAQLGTAVSERDTLRTAVQILTRPQTRTVAFGASESGPHGRVLVDRLGGLVFLASALPSTNTGRALELWLVPKTGAPVPAGLLSRDASGSSLKVIGADVRASQLKALAVSDEPETGSTAPTTKPFLLVPIG